MQFAAPNPGGTQLISFFLNLQSTKETMDTWSNTQSQGTTALSGNSLHSGRTQRHYLLLEKMAKDSKKCLRQKFWLYWLPQKLKLRKWKNILTSLKYAV